MKRLIGIGLLGLMAASLSGCGLVLKNEVRFKAEGPAFETVVDYLRLGNEEGARNWLEKVGASSADTDELIVRAKVHVIELLARCQGKALCESFQGAAAAAEAAVPPKER